MRDESADECPFAKPFPDDFRDCEVYGPRLVFPTDASNHPLEPIWTCAHLQVASRVRGGWYPSCGFGDAAGRARWLKDRGQLATAMAVLRADTASWAAPLLRRLAAANSLEPPGRAAEVAAIRESLVANFELALVRHEAELAAAGADPVDLRDAFRQVIDADLLQRSPEPLANAAPVAGFGLAARLLFTPETEANAGHAGR